MKWQNVLDKYEMATFQNVLDFLNTLTPIPQALIDELKEHPQATLRRWIVRSKDAWKRYYQSLGIDVYNYLHRPTIAQFLKNPLPLILHKAPTICAHSPPRQPKNVTAWPEFKQGATDFKYPQVPAHSHCIIPNYTGEVIQCEIPDIQGIVHAHLCNFNLVLSQLGFTCRFRSVKPNDDLTFTGKPDHFLCDGPNVLSFVEDRTPWHLPRGDLAQMWNEDQDGCFKEDLGRSSVKDLIEQVYGYLSFNRMRYGMLTCYDVTYFVSRPAAGLLMISDPIVFDSTEPTVLECIYYFTELVQKSGGSADVSSSDTDEPPHPGDKNDSGNDSKAKKRKLNNELARDEISHITPKNIQNRQLIGEGASGQVFLLPNKSQVIKVCDKFNNPDGYHMLVNEIEIYKHMQKFDLDFVPMYYFDEEVYGQHFLVIEFVPGKPCNWRDSEHESKVRSCLKQLQRFGVKHRDTRPENVLLSDDGKISIIDFGVAELMYKSWRE
eukprot:Partr_v1_DN28610_c4_g2_i5_m50323